MNRIAGDLGAASPRPSQLSRKSEVLLKLIRVEPESLTRLVQQTGWGQEATQQALSQLLAADLVRTITKDGVRVYAEMK